MNSKQFSYWTQEEHDLLKDVKNFESMVPIGINLLKQVSKDGDNIIMICGPMSTGGLGSLRANREFFKLAQKRAISGGWHIFDQQPFEEAIVRLSEKEHIEKGYCYDILHIFYRGLFKSGLIKEFSFLPDWQSSIGASWERQEALDSGIKVSDYPMEWAEETKKISSLGQN